MKDFWDAYVATFDRNLKPISSNAIQPEPTTIFPIFKPIKVDPPIIQPFSGFFSSLSDNNATK
jgi:hypothetical protein